SSTWTAVNVASLATLWTVSEGTLQLDGVLANGSSIGVVGGGTLSGTGVVEGIVTVDSGATIAPGNGGTPLGVLSVGGLVQNAGGTMSIGADGAGNSSRLQVSGTATLAGNLNVAFTAPPALGQSYAILSGGT